MSKVKPHVLVILGPTASGKTKLACKTALALDGEIISADSRQVYVGMDIGTGKDLDEYTIGDVEIPYHLINIKPPNYHYNIAEYQLDFYKALEGIMQRKKTPILCGGSGLYIESALQETSFLGIPKNENLENELSKLSEEKLQERMKELSPMVKKNLNAKTRGRMHRAIVIDQYLREHPEFKSIQLPEIDYTIFGVDIARETRRQNITNRLSYRLNHGLIEEVEQLLKGELTHQDLEHFGLEYKWVGRYLREEITKKELFDGLSIAIHQFAKRQMTWFRRMENNGYTIHWLNASDPDEKRLETIRSIYQD